MPILCMRIVIRGGHIRPHSVPEVHKSRIGLHAGLSERTNTPYFLQFTFALKHSCSCQPLQNHS